MNKLTDKQELVLQFIHRYLAEHRRSPFIREIQTGCAIASYKSVVDRLNALEHKGYIKRTPNKHRSIKLADKGKAWTFQLPPVPVAPSADAPALPMLSDLPTPVVTPLPLEPGASAIS